MCFFLFRYLSHLNLKLWYTFAGHGPAPREFFLLARGCVFFLFFFFINRHRRARIRRPGPPIGRLRRFTRLKSNPRRTAGCTGRKQSSVNRFMIAIIMKDLDVVVVVVFCIVVVVVLLKIFCDGEMVVISNADVRLSFHLFRYSFSLFRALTTRFVHHSRYLSTLFVLQGPRNEVTPLENFLLSVLISIVRDYQREFFSVNPRFSFARHVLTASPN